MTVIEERFLQECLWKQVYQERNARVSLASAVFGNMLFTRVSRKSPWECPSRVPSKSLPQYFPLLARVSHRGCKSASARKSSKSILQCRLGVVLHVCLQMRLPLHHTGRFTWSGHTDVAFGVIVSLTFLFPWFQKEVFPSALPSASQWPKQCFTVTAGAL